MPAKASPLSDLTGKQCAALLGISIRSFHRIKAEDSTLVFSKGGKGKADIYPTKAFGEWLRDRSPAGQTEGLDDIDEMEVKRAVANEQIGKGRKFLAEAGIKENDLLVKQQKFGEIETMTLILSLVGKQIRTIMESIPSRLSSKYDWMTADQLDLIKTEIAEGMNDVAQLDEDWVLLASRTEDD